MFIIEHQVQNDGRACLARITDPGLGKLATAAPQAKEVDVEVAPDSETVQAGDGVDGTTENGGPIIEVTLPADNGDVCYHVEDLREGPTRRGSPRGAVILDIALDGTRVTFKVQKVNDLRVLEVLAEPRFAQLAPLP